MRMRWIVSILPGILLFLSSLTPASVSPTDAAPPILAGDLSRHVAYLADPAREGRGLGTAGIDAAAAYIAAEFDRFGLDPGAPGGTYFQPFDAVVKTGKIGTRNVVAVLPGSAEGVRPYIIVGAHYDHLGYGDLENPGKDIYPGADDNASGVAGILELAEYFASAEPLRHTLIFIAFSGEEEGLIGSAYYVDHPTVPLESVLAMINLDAVGRPDAGEVTLFGTNTAVEFDSVLALANRDHLDVKTEGDGVGPSDHASFALKRIPALHLFGAAHTDYHRPTDTPEKLNYPGLEEITRFAANLVEVLDAAPDSLNFRELPRTHHTSAHGGKTPHLGIIPDFGASDKGMAIRGVAPGSPAEKAGLASGDVIVRLGDARIADIQDLFEALNAHSPGDRVEIEVLRASERLTLKAVLGESRPSIHE